MKTEPDYLNYLRSKLGTTGVTIEIARSGRDPLNLVRRAASLKSEDVIEARRSRDIGNTFDSVWVMTDVDDFGESVPSAIKEGADADIRVAVSNPCFEIWLVWHIKDQGYCSTKAIQSTAVEIGVMSDANSKEVVLTALEGNYEIARSRARDRRSAHDRAETVSPDDNPSSSVDLLVEAFLEAARSARPGSSPVLT
ncbi:RloB family protein [Rathayibacter sp. VKM Ac-2928]|nr:RloB family protein [Rathayibacter sp. VKM Ac-2928]